MRTLAAPILLLFLVLFVQRDDRDDTTIHLAFHEQSLHSVRVAHNMHDAMDETLDAFHRLHEQFYKSENLAFVDLASQIEMLCDAIADNHHPSREDASIAIRVDAAIAQQLDDRLGITAARDRRSVNHLSTQHEDRLQFLQLVHLRRDFEQVGAIAP